MEAHTQTPHATQWQTRPLETAPGRLLGYYYLLSSNMSDIEQASELIAQDKEVQTHKF